MRNALITGITGFVGSHLADFLLTRDVKVHGLSRWRSPKENIQHLGDQITLEHGDLLDFSSLLKVLQRVKPDYVFHLAAQSYVPYSFDAPAATLDVNCIGTCNLFEAIKTCRDLDKSFDPVIHACSSSEVYGQVREDEIPITEDNPFRPASPYAVSKVCEDMLALQYFLSWKLKIIRTRLFTHTGARRGDVFVVSNFAKQIADIEINDRPPVIKVGNLNSLRTFMDVKDAVKAYWLIVNSCPFGEVFNIGGETTMTIGEMLDCLLKKSTRSDIKIELDPARLRPSDVTLQVPSTKKFRDMTGWIPIIPFDQTMEDTLGFWREHMRKMNI